MAQSPDHPITQSSMTFACPICKTPTAKTTHADFPFCSERCRALDLGNWASGRYVVSTPIIDEDDLDDASTATPDEKHDPQR
jgi:endogenous inhibitor of DNA gyrase (YacG/DUF329 family)